MGTCSMRNCRCMCTQSRISCQCGSVGTLQLEQVREERAQQRLIKSNSKERTNRFAQQQSGTKKKSTSRESSDSINKTKFSTNRKQTTNRSPNSIERQMMSEECNIISEPSKPKKKKRVQINILNVQQKTIYFSEEKYLKQQQQIQQQQLEQQSSIKSPQFQSKTFGTLEQFQSQGDSLKPGTSQTTEMKGLSENMIKLQELRKEASIAAHLDSPTEQLLKKPQTQLSVEAQNGSGSRIKDTVSLQAQNEHINRSKTAVESSDDQKSMTPRGVLKRQQESNDSLYTQQQQKRKVRFDLPHSHYLRERNAHQQMFFC